MTLRETQALFHALVTRAPGAEGVAVDSCFVGTQDLSAAERVEIYARMYRGRMVDALREDFPKIAEILGDESFGTAVANYLREHPSEHPDLGRIGRRFEDYLRSAPPAGAPVDLADLAALEWARAEVFLEADGAPATRAALKQIELAAFAGTRLRFVSAFRLLSLEHDPLPAWRALEAGAPVPDPTRRPTRIAVWRPAFEVFHTDLPTDEVEAVRRALAGSPISEVCEAFATRPSPAEAAHAAIGGWFDEGWIAALVP